MTNDHERGPESSDPPPPHPSEANSVDISLSRSDHAVAKARAALNSAHGAEAVAEDAVELAQEALDVSKAIEAKLGCSPDPVLGVPGRGLFGVFATLSGEVHVVGTKLDTLVASLTADRAAAEAKTAARRGSTARLIGWVMGPTCALLVGYLAAYLAGFHR